MGDLFAAVGASEFEDLAGYVAVWVAYGLGLTIVFWTLGYLVWFIVQFFR